MPIRRKVILMAGLLVFGMGGLEPVGAGERSVSTSGANFLGIKASARASSVGEAFTGVDGDIDAIDWNPAGLSGITTMDLTFTHLRYGLGVNYEHLAVVNPFGFGRIGLSLSLIHTAFDDLYEQGVLTAESYFLYNFILGIAYQRDLFNFISLGGKLKYLKESLGIVSASSVAFDFGGLVKLGNKINLGVSVGNLGLGVRFDKVSNSLPLDIRFGAMVKPIKVLNLLFDMRMDKDAGFTYHGGVEILPRWLISPRIGYFSEFNKAYFTAGVGIKKAFGIYQSSLDYAFTPYGDLGNNHFFSFKLARPAFEFGFGVRGKMEYSAKKINIAVMDLTGQNVSQMDVDVITENLRTELINSQKFTVVQRTDMERILQEQGREFGKCTADECAVEIGRILDVQKMIVGSVTRFMGEYIINVKYVDTETGAALFAEKMSCKEGRKLLEITKQIADKLQSRVVIDKKYRKEAAEELVVEKIEIGNVFSSMYKYYSKNPIGKITIKNNLKKPLSNTRVNLFIKDYMDFSTESPIVEKIKPGEEITVPLFASYNNNVLTVTEDTPLNSLISVIYYPQGKLGRKEKITRTQKFKLYNRNAMVWDRIKKLGAFITPRDTIVKIFARSVIQKYKDEETGLPENLAKAAMIFDALSAYGVTYVSDPQAPFKGVTETPGAVDYIQYPRGTLRYKTGDCDDCVALFCALLENVGISTILLDVPGHIFMMFDSGVPEDRAGEVSLDSKMYAIHKGNVWIPVEVTMFGKRFSQAWEEAARGYREHTLKGTIKMMEVREAWRDFVPVTLEEIPWEPEVPAREDIDRFFRKDLQEIKEKKALLREKKIEEIKKSALPEAKKYNKLGLAYARENMLKEAKEEFKKVLHIDPANFSAYNNMGNVYLLEGNKPKAMGNYKKALEIKPDSVRTLLNIANLYYEDGQFDKANEYYQKATGIEPLYKDEFSYLGIEAKEGAEEERGAGVREKIKPLWEE